MSIERCNNWFDDEKRCDCDCKKIDIVIINAALAAIYLIVVVSRLITVNKYIISKTILI